MKKYRLLKISYLIALFFVAGSVFSQPINPINILMDPVATNCGIYDINLNTQQYINVANISMTLDLGILAPPPGSWSGISFNPILASSGALTYYVNTDGKLKVSWSAQLESSPPYNQTSITLPDNTVLFTMTFDVSGHWGESVDFAWDDVLTIDCELSGPNGYPIYPDYWNDLHWDIPNELAGSLSHNKTDFECANGTKGSIDLTVGGGVPPYSYAWTGTVQQPCNTNYITYPPFPGGTTEDLTDLYPGNYCVIVTDATNCVTASYCVTIDQVDLPAPSEIGTVATSGTVECDAQVAPPTNLPVVQDACGYVLSPDAGSPAISGNYIQGCEGDVIYTYTYTDFQCKTFTWVYTLTVNRTTAPAFVSTPPANTATVECYADIVLPTLPEVKDVCGNTIIEPTPVEDLTGYTAGCEGTITYTYTYTDACDGSLELVYVFTVTVNRTTAPAFVSTPPANTATVECYADIVLPTLPEVKDVCGNTILEPTPVEDLTGYTAGCEGTITYTYTYTDACDGSLELVYVFTVTVNRTTAPAFVSTPPANTATVECYADIVLPTLPEVKDVCGNTILEPTPVEDLTGYTAGCEGTITYTYTYTDACDGSLELVYVFTVTVNRTTAPAFVSTPPANTATVECYADIVLPTLPEVKDVCGNTILEPTPVEDLTGYTAGCEGTITYTYTYTDACDGSLELVYVFTVTVNRTTAPAFVSTPPANTATVECYADIVLPTLPEVKDVCGNTILEPTPVEDLTGYTVGCEGTITYTYTYTDACDGSLELVYVFTVTVDRTLNPTVVTTAPQASTVECYADAIPPTVLPVVEDVCGAVISAPTPVKTGTYAGCEGTVIYTYTYIDPCDGSLMLDWIYTYTIDYQDFTANLPANGSSTVECWADAVPPLYPVAYPDADIVFTTYMSSVADQSQTTMNGYFYINTGIGQSFEPAVSGDLTQIDVDVMAFTGSPTFNIEVYLGDGKTGSPLYSASGFGVSTTGPQSFSLPAGMALTAGTQYTFWLTPYPFNSVQLRANINGDPYAGGQAWDELNTPVPVFDNCGNPLAPSAPVIVDNYPDPLSCNGTRTYTYTYADCSGFSNDWVYTYNVIRTTPPAEVGGPVPIASTVECEVNAVVPTTLPVINDVCGVTLSPVGPNKQLVNTMPFDDPVILSATQAAGVWYVDRYAPAGFVSPTFFNGDNRLMHSINAADFQGNPSFYATQGRAYDLGSASDYMEIQLYVPADWETANKRMAGFWGVAVDASDVVSGYPIVEFTSDGGNPRFHVWESGTGYWIDLGLPTGFTYNSWVTLKIRLLPSGEFLLSAGDLDYVTVTSAPDASVRLKSVILQGYNYDPVDPNIGVTYDIYWDDFAWNDTYSTICEGIITYTYTYVDCAGLYYVWTYTYTVDDTQNPTITCPADITVFMNNGCTWLLDNMVLGVPTVGDNCTVNPTYWNDAPSAFNEGVTPVTWTVEDCAGNSASCVQYVEVIRNTLSGTLVYNNILPFGPDKIMNNVTIGLFTDAALTNQVGSSITNFLGQYSFPDLCAGDYYVAITNNNKPAGGVNTTDAGQVLVYGFAPYQIECVRWLAGETDGSPTINIVDVGKIVNEFVYGSGFAPNKEDWNYYWVGCSQATNTSPTLPMSVTLAGGNDVKDIFGQCTGDFNGNFAPGVMKSSFENLALNYRKNMLVSSGSEFELPIFAGSDMEVGAVSLILNFPANETEITGAYLSSDPTSPVVYNVNGNELRISWYSLSPVWLNEGEALITLKMKTTSNEAISFTLAESDLNELADGNFEVISNASLVVDIPSTSALGIGLNLSDKEVDFVCHPNPFKGTTNFSYSLPESGQVIIEVYDLVGSKVLELVNGSQTAGKYSLNVDANDLQPGVYTAILRVQTSDDKIISRAIKLVNR